MYFSVRQALIAISVFEIDQQIKFLREHNSEKRRGTVNALAFLRGAAKGSLGGAPQSFRARAPPVAGLTPPSFSRDFVKIKEVL